MPMPILEIPEFPDVPDLPGVPAIARSLVSQVAAGVNGFAGLVGLSPLITLALPVWGVFDQNNVAVALADSVRTLDFDSESRVSDYPQEQGAFESYNKVQLPYASTVSLTCGGDASRRAAFLVALQAAKDSTNLYSIVTPEIVYLNANIVGLRYRRTTTDGATLLTVDLHLEEIRVTATAAFANTNTQNPASADAFSMGQVQGQTPSAAMSSLFGPVSAVQGVGGVLT
jgi:hypothetical protein